MTTDPVVCPYCNNASQLVSGRVIYPYRKDLWVKTYFLCKPCFAYVGCHPDGKPMGRLADKRLRTWKIRAHASFDSLWREGYMSRSQAYKWLAKALKLSYSKCHIGMFDIAGCQHVIEICEAWKKERKA